MSEYSGKSHCFALNQICNCLQMKLKTPTIAETCGLRKFLIQNWDFGRRIFTWCFLHILFCLWIRHIVSRKTLKEASHIDSFSHAFLPHERLLKRAGSYVDQSQQTCRFWNPKKFCVRSLKKKGLRVIHSFVYSRFAESQYIYQREGGAFMFHALAYMFAALHRIGQFRYFKIHQ